MLRFTAASTEHFFSRMRGLTFDMSGGGKGAKRPLERPLDGSVRPLVEKVPARPCVQQGNANAARRDMHAHERHSVRDPAVRGNPKLHLPGKTGLNGAFNGRSRLTTRAGGAEGGT